MSSAVTYTSTEMLPKLAEWHVYGNEQQGRFLTKYPEQEPTYYGVDVTEDIRNGIFSRQLGKKAYELKDHLGNVRVTFSDIKMPTGVTNQPFMVDLLSKSEYYPFGMKINELSYNATGARYGYNGTHEQDLEVNASGNYVDFGNFGYDTRVAMRRNQEPLSAKYQSLSTYSIFNSNPIYYRDPSGNFGVPEHVLIKMIAHSIAYNKAMNSLQIINLNIIHNEADIVDAFDEDLHIDNYTNAQLSELIVSGRLSKSADHTKDDFYCHTNYIEILLENGYSKDDDLPTICELENTNIDVYNIMLKNIVSTNNNTKPVNVLFGLADIFISWGIPSTTFEVNNSNGINDHDSSKEKMRERTGSEYGNSKIFYSKHYGHALFDAAMKISIKAAVENILMQDDLEVKSESTGETP